MNIQKWRPLFSSLIPSDPKARNPPSSFRPHLLFSDSIPNPFLRCKVPSSSQIEHRPRFPSNTHPSSNPRPRNVQSRPNCFRCGSEGHLAKSCRALIRCYHCGGYGHKRIKCSSFRKARPKLSIISEKGRGCDNISWFLHTTQSVEQVRLFDSMLLDPDVTACYLANSAPPVSGEQFLEASDLVLGPSEVSISLTSDGLALVSGDPVQDMMTDPNTSFLKGFSFECNLVSLKKVNRIAAAYDKRTEGSKIRSKDRGSSVMSRFSISRKLRVNVGIGAFMNRLSAPYSATQDRLCASNCLSINLSDIRILDRLNADCCFENMGESQAELSFYIKPCKFFLYCFLAAFRHQASLTPPVGSWKSQLFSDCSSFISSSPDNAAVDRCIFGNEKVFSRKSPDGTCKKKLHFYDNNRCSPRLSSMPQGGAP